MRRAEPPGQQIEHRAETGAVPADTGTMRSDTGMTSGSMNDSGAMRSDTGMSSGGMNDTAGMSNRGGASGTDSAKANQTKSGVTNTETGKSTPGKGVTQTRPDQNQPVTFKGDTVSPSGQPGTTSCDTSTSPSPRSPLRLIAP